MPEKCHHFQQRNLNTGGFFVSETSVINCAMIDIVQEIYLVKQFLEVVLTKNFEKQRQLFS